MVLSVVFESRTLESGDNLEMVMNALSMDLGVKCLLGHGRTRGRLRFVHQIMLCHEFPHGCLQGLHVVCVHVGYE